MATANAGSGWSSYPGSDIVSGEAVLLDLQLATFPSRALAKLLDMALQVVLLIGAVFLLAEANVDSDAATAVFLVTYVGVIVGYPLVWESLGGGRTLGKLALGLRVVRDDGGSARFRHALVRALVGVVEIWMVFGTIAILTSLASSKGKRVGDHLAGTVVVRERVPQSAGPVLPMPTALAGWAAGLELSRLPDHLALAARQMLGRAYDLGPTARTQMAQQVAYDVSRYVSPPPPPGCPPEAYLAAVLAERRRREIARLPKQTYQPAPQALQPPLQPAQPAPQAPLPADPNGFQLPG